MTIDWLFFPIALVLLWFPRSWLRLGPQLLRVGRSTRHKRRVAELNARDSGDRSVKFKTEFSKVRNYVDFLRAAIGAVALVGGEMLLNGDDTSLPSSLLAGPDATQVTINTIFWVRLAIILVGVVIQCLRVEGRVTLFPPIFYLTGIVFALGGTYTMLFSILLIWTINLGLRTPLSFLGIYGLLVACFGCLFRTFRPEPLVAAGLIWLPALLSLLTRRSLATFTKKLKSGR